MKQKLFHFIIRHRLAIAGVLLGVTLLCGWFAAQVKFDNTIETYFLEEDIASYEQFLAQFGTDEIIAIAFEDTAIFTTGNLRLIDTLSRRLENMPHVRRVLSLTTAKIVYGDTAKVSFERLIEEMPDSEAEMRAIKQRSLDDPFIPGTLLSPDAKKTAIVAEIDHLAGEFDYKVALLEQIRSLLKEQERETGKKFRTGGTAVLDDAMFRYNQRDQARFIPLMVVAMLLIVFAMFRRLEIVALPVVIVLLSVIWTYGLLVLLGYKINLISTIITPLLMAIAIADSMHFITDYLQEAMAGDHDKIDCLRHSFDNLFTPCLMTSLTTAIGLLSLLSADLAPIRQFGLVAASGVLFAFLLTILLLPILLSILPYPKEKYRARMRQGFFLRLLHWLGRWRRKRAAAILAIALLLALPAIFALRQLTIGTNTLDYFRPGDIVRAQTEWIDSGIGGTASLEFFIDTGEMDALKEPALLRKMDRFESELEAMDGITGVYSAVDLVKALNKAFHAGDPGNFAIPVSAAEVAQQLLLVEGSADLAEFLSEEYDRGRISARVEIGASQKLSHRVQEIEQRMQEIFGNTFSMQPTGLVYLMHTMERYLLSSQIKSFLLAFVLIAVAILLMLGSVRLGLLAMIPNFLPILFTLALMPLLGIALDVGTVMIASVALGLVVDDTIHFLARLKEEAARHSDIRQATSAAMHGAGRPIIFTSVILSLGFLVLMLASFNPVIHFGILSCIVIILALLFDLLVLPAMMGFVGLKNAQPKIDHNPPQATAE